MKTLKLFTLVLALGLMAACGNNNSETDGTDTMGMDTTVTDTIGGGMSATDTATSSTADTLTTDTTGTIR